MLGHSKKKIIVIEDEPDLAGALKEVLEGEGYDVLTAGTGEEGIEIIKSEDPDLLLLDSLLPGINGIGVLDALEDYRKDHKLAIIALSNMDDPEDVKQVRERGVDEYLIKTDWRIEDVVATVKRHL